MTFLSNEERIRNYKGSIVKTLCLEGYYYTLLRDYLSVYYTLHITYAYLHTYCTQYLFAGISNPSSHSLNTRLGVCILAAAFRLIKQTQGIIHIFARERLPRRVFAIIGKFFLGVFKRITLIVEQMLYQLAHIYIFLPVLPRSARRSERVKLFKSDTFEAGMSVLVR